MLHLSTPGYLRFSQARQFDATFGGGEANVAVSLANYGVDAHFVTRLPKNDIADMCTAELKGFGVNTDSIVYGGDRVGIYYLETGAVEPTEDNLKAWPQAASPPWAWAPNFSPRT